MGRSALAKHVLNESSFEFGEKPDGCFKNMREELLLGTAVAPSHMYLFPLGTVVLSEQPVGSIHSKAANSQLYSTEMLALISRKALAWGYGGMNNRG